MRLSSGQVEHGRCSTAVLTEEEKTDGWFRSCWARALADLAVTGAGEHVSGADRVASAGCMTRLTEANSRSG
jgi:hypothetical protein